MASAHSEDERFMHEALAEGAKGLGTTSPNPPVGAVVVRDGEVIGRGWHERVGEPHAERHALGDAERNHGPAATRGATLYVTLEPCSTHGRTPPCTEAILASGIARVVVSATDPNPAHAGAGLDLLREAGVEVTTGVLEKEGLDLIRFFARHITTGRPWIIAKTAATLDGHTTLPESMGRWISNEAAREDVQSWRRQCDAILVGGETFRRDNPALTLRGKWAEGRPQPWRVVLTSDVDLPETHQLFNDLHRERTIIHEGLTLPQSLDRLGEIGVCSVMLESGGRLLTHALGEGLVDEMILYLAPLLGGGGNRILAVEGLVARLENPEYLAIGDNLRVRGRVAKP
jgi:diaminohydroxyphosphoribosylaminopyrimidine deaminase/5-amino-6-(5-phosphoribosylamino)uracil reductase